jgi:hypothetical protein
VAVLSDTEGVDFSPYIERLLAALNHKWESVKPEIGGPRFRNLSNHTGRQHLGSRSSPRTNIRDQAYDDAVRAAVRASSPFEADGPLSIQLPLELSF